MKKISVGLMMAATIASSTLAAAAYAQTVTYGTDGGAIHEVMLETLIRPAEEKLGITVISDQNADRYPVVKAQVLSGKPQWDLFDAAAGYCARGQMEDLLEPLDYSLIPNAENVPEAFRTETSIGLAAYATVLAYSTSAFGADGPKSWADFWNVEEFPGRRALRNYARPMLEIALLADGVTPAELYPLDVDRAYAKLEEIKPHVAVWWTSGAESAQLLYDGEVDMLPIWDGRASAAIEEGAEAEFSREQAILEYSCMAVLKGAPNRENAMRFINELLDPEGQAGWATQYITGPLNVEFAQYMEPDRLSRLASAPENLKVQVPLSAEWWASPEGEEAERRWLEFMQR